MKRLEEALEESLSAYLAGRRSVEESLSLYPALAAELEPLLRAATQVSDSLQKYSPPAAVQERGLQRFLSDARARARVKTLTGGMTARPGWFASLFSAQHRMGLVAASAAVALVAVAVTAASLSNDGDETGATSVREFTPAPTATAGPGTPLQVSAVHQRVNSLQQRLRASQPVAPEEIDALTQSVRELGLLSSDEIAGSRAEVEQTLHDVGTLLDDIQTAQPDLGGHPVVKTAEDTVREVVGLISGSPTAAATATPAGETAAPTAPPTATPHPTQPVDTPVPTPAPSDTPAPTEPGPTETPGIRELQGLGG